MFLKRVLERQTEEIALCHVSPGSLGISLGPWPPAVPAVP